MKTNETALQQEHEHVEEEVIEEAISSKVGDVAPEIVTVRKGDISAHNNDLLDPTSWSIFETSESSWQSMLDDISSAKHSVCFLQYLLEDLEKDHTGWKFIDACEQRASEGIRVTLIIDPVGSFKLFKSQDILERIRAKGITVLFNGFRTSFTSLRFPHVHADHRKMLIVDNNIAHVGGVVWSDIMKGWSDVMVRYEGALVKSLVATFENIVDTVENDADLCIVNHEGEDEWFIVQQRPGIKNRDITDALVEHVKESKKRVRIVTPYFSPPRILKKEMLNARKRGVEIEIIIPNTIDHPVVGYVNKSFISSMLKQGIKIYLFQPYSLHAKFLTVDSCWVSVGSCNMDVLSNWMNYELNINSLHTHFVKDMDDVFDRYCDKSVLVTKEIWNERTIKEKILTFISRIARPIA